MVVGLELVHVDCGVGWLNNHLGLKHFLREVLGDFIDVQTHYDVQLFRQLNELLD